MKVLLVDALNLIRRIFAAIPSDGSALEEKARVEKTITSCKLSLERALLYHQPSHCIVVFEEGSRNWRHSLLPSYKQNRPPMPANLAETLPKIKQAFKEAGANSFSFFGFEADDVIATLAKKISQNDNLAVILSTDKLQAQSIGEYIKMYDHFNDCFVDSSLIQNKFQVTPELLVDLYAMAGDTGQSIPGIKSVGKKTATKLIHDYGSLDNILSQVDNIPGALGRNLKNGKQDALLAKQLFTLKTDLDLGINLNQFRYTPQSSSNSSANNQS